MVWGSLATSLALIILGWAVDIVGFVSPTSTEDERKPVGLVLAVLSIYVIDFAINVVGACARGLVVDTLPVSKQQLGSAWASRMGAAGNIIGYAVGTLDLDNLLPGWLGGDSQFKKMTCISIFGLWLCIGITCYAVTERVLLPSSPGAQSESIASRMRLLWRRTLDLPPRIQSICWVQFWSWIGWFPFLFYGTTWVGETYYRYEYHPSHDPELPDDHDALGNVGRLGSLSLIFFSVITFASSVVLPSLVRPHALVDERVEKYTPRPPSLLPDSVSEFLVYLRDHRPDLLTMWLISNLSFASLMAWAPFVHSLSSATFLVALAGVPWAISGWAPFAEMGVEINRLAPEGTSVVLSRGGAYSAIRTSVDGGELTAVEQDGHELRRRISDAISEGSLHLQHADDSDAHSSTGELAGLYLGVLNVYTTLPQFVATFISWIVFLVFEPDKSQVKDDDPEHHRWLDVNQNAPNAIAICLFVGAMSSLVAVEATRRLKKLS